MWLAWVGFNFSHSLGAVVFGAFATIVGRSAATFRDHAWIRVPFAVCVSATYLGLAAKYWFRVPIIACALSVALFLASWGTLAVGVP